MHNYRNKYENMIVNVVINMHFLLPITHIYTYTRARAHTYLYLRVSLFELSSRRTNLMNLDFGLLQLFLPTSTYNTFMCDRIYTHITDYFTFLHVLVLIYLHLLFTVCLVDLRTWPTVIPAHVCLPVHATWLHFMYSLGYFLTIPDLHVQNPELG